MAAVAATASAVRTLHGAERTLGQSVDAFLARPDYTPGTRRSYTQTLTRLTKRLGAGRRLADVSDHDLAEAVTGLWGKRSPAYWNRNVATVRSWLAWCRRHGWPVGDLALRVDRRKEPADNTKAIPYAELERLWRRDDIAVREKTLWRLCYETAARAAEILGLDIGDLDLANKRARVRSKGGDTDWVYFQTGAARLLPRLIGGRTRGPLFLTDRQPPPGRAPADEDLDRDTGRARLSYRRAEEIFQQASGGWTLHQLRHSALTHLGEQNISGPLLMAKSRHASLRSLQRYVRPGPDAVAALTAATDPERRRR
jgi:integrase